MKALSFRGSNIRTLHIHSVPFFGTESVRLILASLFQLENLGIYNCELIHFGMVWRLLSLAKHSLTADNERTAPVNIDVYPRFHEGPSHAGRVGSYGIFWQEAGVDAATGDALYLGGERE